MYKVTIQKDKKEIVKSFSTKEEANKEKKSLIKRHDLKRVVGFWGNSLTRVELSTNY